MNWNWDIDGWIVAISAVCAMACALPGCFLVLRRMSMMGDAISHAVLPGLALAFLMTGERSSGTMFIGAAVVGLLTALFTQWVHSFGKVDSGASMGVVFTSLFAVGLIVIVRAADHVDLDPSCVLYGAVELAPLDTTPLPAFLGLGPLQVPRAILVLGGVLLLNASLVAVFFKELRISAFDPGLATTLGINATAMHYMLMAMTAVTTVAAFEVIGSILVIAMLIVPAAAAHLLTDRLGSMVLVSMVLAAVSAVTGHLAAIGLPAIWGLKATTSSGMMAASAGLIFVLVMFLSPRHGIVLRWWNQSSLSLRIACEDILGLLYRLEESKRHVPLQGLLDKLLGLGRITRGIALASLRREGKILGDADHLKLTEKGRARATEIVRTHRLWETFLAEHLSLPVDHVHAPAEKLEHITTAQMQQRLADESRHPTHDPHGKRVPE